jgi:hypothetical protein
MTIERIHREIELGLQNVNLFAYSDMEHDEIDSCINIVVSEIVRNMFKEESLEKPLQKNQYESDFLAVLYKEHSATPTKFDDYCELELPIDYLHLLSDYSKVYKNCGGLITSANKLELGSYYRAVSRVILDLNESVVAQHSIFKAESESFSGTVQKVSLRKSFNRLIRHKSIREVLDNTLSKTSFKSPVSQLVFKKLRIYLKDFDIDSITVCYVKKPVECSYENNITLEFSDETVKMIVLETIQYISIIKEVEQQKILNLEK